MNGQYYASLLLKLRDAIKEKRWGMLPRGVWLLHDNAPVHKSMIAQEAVHDCGFVQLDHPAYSPDLALPVTILYSAIWSLTFVVSATVMMKCSRKLSRSDWSDRQKISILVELTVCQKNVANALNSVVILLKDKVQFVTFPFFFIAKLQKFLKAPRTQYTRLLCTSQL